MLEMGGAGSAVLGPGGIGGDSWVISSGVKDGASDVKGDTVLYTGRVGERASRKLKGTSGEGGSAATSGAVTGAAVAGASDAIVLAIIEISLSIVEWEKFITLV